MNAWLKRCFFNLDLNRESVSVRMKMLRAQEEILSTDLT